MNAREKLPLPEPSAGLDEYDHEREACLNLDARKRENYMRFIGKERRTATVDYLPIKLDIENVSRCNFRCTMCAVSQWRKGKRARDMCFHEFKNLIDQQYGLVEIKLNGLGEALMQGEEYFSMIRYARSKRIWVRMTTNASLLHVRNNYRKLVDADVNEIDISIDGADKQTFEAIRVQGDFDQVTQNCKLLNRHLQSHNMVRTKMWTLVQEGNYRRLDEHVALAKDLGFHHLVFSLNLHGWGDSKLEERNRSVTVDYKLSQDWLWSLVEQGAKEGLRVSYWQVNEKFDAAHLCPWPFERAVVTSDLRVTPCCMIGNPDKFEIGRGSGKGFTELWGGKEYEAFRQTHLDGQMPKVCKGCYK